MRTASAVWLLLLLYASVGAQQPPADDERLQAASAAATVRGVTPLSYGDDRLPTLVIKYKDSVPPQTARAVNAQLVALDASLTAVATSGAARAGGGPGRVKRTQRLHSMAPRTFVVDTDSVAAAEELVAAAAADPTVEAVWLDSKVYALAVPPECGTDLCSTSYYGFDRISAPLVWRSQDVFGGVAKKVAVIDTGVWRTHTELADSLDLAGSQNCINACVLNSGNDDNGHGTHCAGTIAARHGGAAPLGVASSARVVACKFLSASGSGALSAATRCIYAMISQGVSVMSNSWGGSGSDPGLEAAVQAACNAGILFVVAAGNSGVNIDTTPSWPAALAKRAGFACVLTVASTDSANALSTFSNFGSRVEIAAPGSGIFSTYSGSDTATATLSGTSMATPHVAGAAVAILNEFPTLTLTQLRAALVNTGSVSPVLGSRSIAGRLLNVSAAYEAAYAFANPFNCSTNTTVCNANGQLCAPSGACVACLAAVDCPPSSSPCVLPTCSATGACGTAAAPTGTNCTLSTGPGKCSAGVCRQCLTATDCGPSGFRCTTSNTCQTCLAATRTCSNNAQCCSNRCRSSRCSA